jgi:hypothetical protein
MGESDKKYLKLRNSKEKLPPGPSGGSQDSLILSLLASVIRGGSGTNEGLALVCHD